MYLYETSRNIQEPWPHDLYFTVCWLQTLADVPWLIFLSSVDSSALLMEQVDILSEALDQQHLLSCLVFMLRGGARGQYLGHLRFCLISQRQVDWWIFYLGYWFSVTHWPETMCVGHWPIFHGPLILPYLAVLNYLPISAYIGLLKFDMKMFVNIARLDYRPVFHSKREVGASVYFGHISSFINRYRWVTFYILYSHWAETSIGRNGLVTKKMAMRNIQMYI